MLFLDHNVLEELEKMKNQSAFVNGMLKDYFNNNKSVSKLNELSIQQLEELKKNYDKQEILQKELEKLKNETKPYD